MDKKYCRICGKEMKWNYTHDDGDWYTCNCNGVLEISKLQKEISELEKEIINRKNRVKEINNNGTYAKMIGAHNKKLERFGISQNDV